MARSITSDSIPATTPIDRRGAGASGRTASGTAGNDAARAGGRIHAHAGEPRTAAQSGGRVGDHGAMRSGDDQYDDAPSVGGSGPARYGATAPAAARSFGTLRRRRLAKTMLTRILPVLLVVAALAGGLAAAGRFAHWGRSHRACGRPRTRPSSGT